ncbi:universal stress protein [Neobacillus piezotolerans]|uniref:Universal stress protein n=1 Tax=Neobacillus piezotolerans TaxID=2259171 RepID=A0A3D8GM96_9BACI|nr:universal stress protein [Neobacillus piezotolerans]RDU35339.1 universal stress protein [Neobacillus piezotolerans]
MPVQFRKIILAYDGSDGSDKALNLASVLVKGNTETKLTVVNVYEEKIETRRVDITGESRLALHGYLIEGMPAPPSSLGYSQAQHSTQAIISNSVDHIFFEAKRRLGDTNASFRVLEGTPAESICDYAEEIGADLIIIGSSGKGGIAGLLIGNITEKVSRHAPCNVLIAK